MDELNHNGVRTEQREKNILQFPVSKNVSLNCRSEGPEPRFIGPISGQMWKRANEIPSSYQDNFDYTVFDKLHGRFGANQPRGGVVFKSFMKLLESEDCKNCFYRFEIDTYGRGCVFNCAYCYAKSYLSIRKYWNQPFPFPLDIGELRRTFATVFETDRPHKFRHVMERRVPLRIGSMSDSFMWLDKKYRVAQELLKILRHYEYPYIIFTRSDLIAEDEYIELLDNRLASVQMSVSSLNEELTRKLEPGAPSPFLRLRALKKLSQLGFWTTVRINPLFPIYPDGHYSDPAFDHSRPVRPFNYFSWDMIPTIAEHNIPSLLVGIARLYQPNLRFMSQALGYDIREHFRQSTSLERASLHFSERETAFYYSEVKRLAAKFGLRFSTCYIGNDPNGDSFYGYQDLWSNKKDCCDALGNVSRFMTTCASLSRDKAKPQRVESQKPHTELGDCTT